ncbi:hypothetical protein P9112_003799 [Eukaryota sp. TZLM1-RC]
MDNTYIEQLRQEVASETRSFLRRKIELRLASELIDQRKFKDALELLGKMASEVRKMDDKSMQIDVLLLEAKVYTELKNYSKAKASLTGARAAANAIYCPPKQAANLDMQSGILHLEEGDANTAFSYFLEAFTSMDGLNEMETSTSLFYYMIVSKLTSFRPQDVPSILSDRNMMRYGGPKVEGLQKMSKAQEKQSLALFEEARRTYFSDETDEVLLSQFSKLSDYLLESNLIALVKPYSCIEIELIARRMGLDEQMVENRLMVMIMDGKLKAFIDQERRVLLIQGQIRNNMAELCDAANQVCSDFNQVCDKIMERAQKVV